MLSSWPRSANVNSVDGPFQGAEARKLAMGSGAAKPATEPALSGCLAYGLFVGCFVCAHSSALSPAWLCFFCRFGPRAEKVGGNRGAEKVGGAMARVTSI